MKKKFDCVAMKREGSRQIYEKVKGMTMKQELAYWQQQHRKLEEAQRVAISKQANTAGVTVKQGAEDG